MQKAKCMLRLPFIVLQDLLVDCFKPTEVRFFLPSFLLQYFLFLNPPSCVWSLLSPRRTSSQSCSTRSEGCRSSPHLRRNDGVLPSASALTFRLPTALSILLFRCQFSSISFTISLFPFCSPPHYHHHHPSNYHHPFHFIVARSLFLCLGPLLNCLCGGSAWRKREALNTTQAA